ncbi:Xaa-Pro dipeptidase [Folsomia candida]|uniref:Xaa-Pro dipeptidase n=1 Tax=Folsomia candida TaxID=158441 RepID=A0A226DWV6_FOLCA|nr:Xaa-Pro dipeptidase [Folsomia candida]
MLVLVQLHRQEFQTDVIQSALNNIYWLMSTLLSQSNGNGLIMPRPASVLFPWVTLWYVCCFFLNNFYQGDIYSQLTAKTSPSVPRTTSELLSSNISIVTSSSIIREVAMSDEDGNLFGSGLGNEIFLQLRLANIGKFADTLRRLDQRAKHVPATATYSYITGERLIAPLAIMDLEKELNQIVDKCEMVGKWVSKRNIDDINLERVSVADGPRNFLLSPLQHGIGQLAQSGLTKLWDDLDKMGKLYMTAADNFNSSNSRYFRRRMINARADVKFNEAQQVSAAAMQYIFVACMELVVLGCMAFIMESRVVIIEIIRISSRKAYAVIMTWMKRLRLMFKTL